MQLKIPGMSVAVMRGDSIILTEGFGYADVANKVKATPSTVFRVASVTKTFTSTLLMQLVQSGKLKLNDPISNYGLDFGNGMITVKDLLVHTSEGEPGTHFQYNGYRFGRLGQVMQKASGISFHVLLMDSILQPLGMKSSAPGISLAQYFPLVTAHPSMKTHFENAFLNLAKAYEVDGASNVRQTDYLDEFGAFGGLATNVYDILKYSKAIDDHQFLSERLQQQVFTSNRLKNGKATPYGLGWFVQTFDGHEFYWHYGQTQGESALFVKVPSLKLTFICLANTDKLSQPFPLADGDLFASPAGQMFYRYFVDENQLIPAINYHDAPAELQRAVATVKDFNSKSFINKELITKATIANIVGDTTSAQKLYKVYATVNFDQSANKQKQKTIAAIENVGLNQQRSADFVLIKTTKVAVYGVGENCSADFSSWCDYGWIEDAKGNIVWQMQHQPAVYAGGAVKNQKVDITITLPAGRYKLLYKSDSGHAFNNWDSAPPTGYFWGINLSNAKTVTTK